MTIVVERQYAGGRFKGPSRELSVGEEFILEIRSTKRMRDHTALVLEVIDPDVIGVSKVDLAPDGTPLLRGIIVAHRDEINDAKIISTMDRGLPGGIVKDVITWRPDPIPTEVSEEA